MYIVGIGEALFDLLPDREVLGGAPLNVVVHAHQLATVLGGRAVMVSRVGADERGRRLRAELSARGLSDRFIQNDADRPTGTVRVTLDRGEPHYDIVRDVAWDRLEFTSELSALAAECSAVCYGTLGRREDQADRTICRFVESAGQAIKLFDVNLRQHFYTAPLLSRGLELATIAKMNETELLVVTDVLGLRITACLEGKALLDALSQALRLAFRLDALAHYLQDIATSDYDDAGLPGTIRSWRARTSAARGSNVKNWPSPVLAASSSRHSVSSRPSSSSRGIASPPASPAPISSDAAWAW